MLESRDLWRDDPPAPRTKDDNYPTLLFSWWCTGFALFIILARLWGRLIRTGRLFREDKVMALSIIPLLIRMGLVHVILIYGTNNVTTDGLNELQIQHRAIGSRLVLASRVFYALFIWTLKFTVSEFLKRLPIWRRSYELGLRCIRIFLFITFFVVVIATLTECQPFDHYWQVVPDPGPRCRNGYAQLITMGTADIITDLLLIFFPIPIFLRSKMPIKRKALLVSLFSLSIILIAITGTRVPEVIKQLGRQQYRTVWASCEILAAAAVSNAVILGSFVRDRGVKRNRYVRSSIVDSIEQAPTRRPTQGTLRSISDEDLFRAIGCRVPQELQDPTSPIAKPESAALPLSSSPYAGGTSPRSSPQGRHDSRDPIPPLNLSQTNAIQTPALTADLQPKPQRPTSSTSRSVAFFDVGGLLEVGPSDQEPGRSPVRAAAPPATLAQDFAVQPSPRCASRNRLNDLSEFLSPTTSRLAASFTNRRPSQQQARDEEAVSGEHDATALQREAPVWRTPALRPTHERSESEYSLRDVGGLLG